MTGTGLSGDRNTPFLFVTLRRKSLSESLWPQTARIQPGFLIGACLFLSENSPRKLFNMSFQVGGQIAFYCLPPGRVQELSHFRFIYSKTVITGRSIALCNFLSQGCRPGLSEGSHSQAPSSSPLHVLERLPSSRHGASWLQQDDLSWGGSPDLRGEDLDLG